MYIEISIESLMIPDSQRINLMRYVAASLITDRQTQNDYRNSPAHAPRIMHVLGLVFLQSSVNYARFQYLIRFQLKIHVATSSHCWPTKLMVKSHADNL